MNAFLLRSNNLNVIEFHEILAFNKTMKKLQKSGLSLKNFTYTNKKIADDIYEAINSTSFLGVSVSMIKYLNVRYNHIIIIHLDGS